MTKRYHKRYMMLIALSALLNLSPIVYYTVKAYVETSILVNKVALSFSIFISIMLTALSLVTKVSLRSTMWILIIGLYLCLDNMLTMIMIIATCQIIDEMIVTPLRKSTKTRLTINKELDKRI